jgi:hypothetical protein
VSTRNERVSIAPRLSRRQQTGLRDISYWRAAGEAERIAISRSEREDRPGLVAHQRRSVISDVSKSHRSLKAVSSARALYARRYRRINYDFSLKLVKPRALSVVAICDLRAFSCVSENTIATTRLREYRSLGGLGIRRFRFQIASHLHPLSFPPRHCCRQYFLNELKTAASFSVFVLLSREFARAGRPAGVLASSVKLER